jgi:cell division septum initiation protein DivIVA
MLEKIAAAQVDEYMAKAASALRTLSTENAQLKTKIAEFERKEQAEKIASIAVDRGVLAEDEATEYAERLISGGEDLKMVEDFVRRSSGGLTLGKTLEKTASAENDVPEGQMDVLTRFLLGFDSNS